MFTSTDGFFHNQFFTSLYSNLTFFGKILRKEETGVFWLVKGCLLPPEAAADIQQTEPEQCCFEGPEGSDGVFILLIDFRFQFTVS